MTALKAAIREQMYEALEETTEDSYQDLKNNVNYFYNAPEGRYKRTGQLRDSPQLDAVSFSGDVAEGQISINTGTQYSPAGRSTDMIYGYAESCSLLGNGNFFKNTEDDIEKNIDRDFGKHFDRA